MKKISSILVLIALLFSSCEKTDNIKNGNETVYGWLVPIDELVINENAHDKIQSIDTPLFVDSKEIVLNPQDEVLVYQTEDNVRIYPVNMIWDHEIVNDRDHTNYFTISYCPLTGSGIAWNRLLNGVETNFGVSGHLYNSNLVPYDRNTSSYWSQMKLEGIKGSKGGEQLDHGYLLHTSFETALAAYPEAEVLFDSGYLHTCDSVCLPPGVKSEREIQGNFGIVRGEDALLFSADLFEGGIKVYQMYFKGQQFVVVGSKPLNFIAAFAIKGLAVFEPVENKLPDIMKDSDGNVYDIMGNVTSGSKKGQRLKAPLSYRARDFAWQLFFKSSQFQKK